MRQLVMLIRHLIAILVLPFVVTVMVPRWLLRGYGPLTQWSSSISAIAGRVVGVAVFLAGISLFLWCLYLFAARGKGTLAPWDPPRNLVVTGPYRYVRNPMISGVLMILLAEALFHGSLTLALWFLTFFLMNVIHFFVFEEPDLERRFGESYRDYRRNVPRWIPRVTPWDQGQ